MKDILPGASGAFSRHVAEFYNLTLANLQGNLLFVADDGVHDIEPWVSDGTEQGTQLIKDINDPAQGTSAAPLGSSHGYASLCYYGFQALLGAAFGQCYQETSGWELWKVTVPSGAASLELTVEDSRDPSPIESPVDYTIKVTNNGTAPATDVILKMEFESPTSASLGPASEEECFAERGVALVAFGFACRLGDLPPNGGTATIKVTDAIPEFSRFQFPAGSNVLTMKTVVTSAEGARVEVSESTTFISDPENTSQIPLTSTQAVLLDGEMVHLDRISGGRVWAQDTGCEAVHLHGNITVDDQTVISDPDPPGCGHGIIVNTTVLRSVAGRSSTVPVEAAQNSATKDGADAPSLGGNGLFHSVTPICPKPSCPGFLLSQDSGDPIYLHSGEVFEYKVDLTIPGRGFDWSFARKYRSGVNFDGPLGQNWDFNYDRRLVELTGDNVDLIPFRNPKTGPNSGDVLRMDAFGRVDVYKLQADQSYSAPAGFYTRLVRNSDGSFEERDYAGRIVRYGAPDNLGNAP